MSKGYYAGTGNRSINFEQGMTPKPEPDTPSEEGPVTFMLTPAERKPFVVPPQEYDKKALGDAMKAFFSERGDPVGTEGPPRYQHGSTNQILAACLAYYAAASKAESGE